jgi:hypothetical protein
LRPTAPGRQAVAALHDRQAGMLRDYHFKNLK